jgi:hypothetical protein
VQWSDGSESIMLGDEVLTMDRKQQPRANTYVHVVRYDAIQVRFDLLCDREGLIPAKQAT